MVREIPLTQGKVALLDDEDYAELSKFKWCAQRTYRNTFYAVRTSREGRRERILMHRQICGAVLPMEPDHINGDGLDNRRENLRVATRRQNMGNVPLLANNTSGFKGVSCFRKNQRWRAQIGVHGRTRYLGSFPTPEAAAHAYDEAARQEFGEFAWLNFPTEGEQDR